MIDQLEKYDQQITIWINQMNAPWLTEVMWNISSLTPFLLLILAATFYAIRKIGFAQTGLMIVFLIVAIALADRISVEAFKNVVQRFRPSHNLDFGHLLNLYQHPNGEFYMGGKYGFISSHAANFGALVTFLILAFKPKKLFILILLFTHLLIIYSRVYLGVHYLGDVVAGSLLGVVCGWVAYRLYFWMKSKFFVHL
jgi:undecaprenyl-diphosphatase